MANIVIPAELEMELKKIIEKKREQIIKFKKPKHREPSLIDAFLYYHNWKKQQFQTIKIIIQKLKETKNFDETKYLIEALDGIEIEL
jgi:late competence protein required for DNA uptake (superfamily II DNA/RNA helicase)